MDAYFKLPRLFIDAPLDEGMATPLGADLAHYLKNVLRRNDGDAVRVFNGKTGEWQATLSGLSKKGGNLTPGILLRPQPAHPRQIHLYCAPLKKTAMDWMIEKAVELGASAIHPVITHNTEVRKINAERLEKQIIEATEQCERLDIPSLFPLTPLEKAFDAAMPILACLERTDAQPIARAIPPSAEIGVLIGPEGGFTEQEKTFLSHRPGMVAVTLGDTILRAETAACYALIAARIS